MLEHRGSKISMMAVEQHNFQHQYASLLCPWPESAWQRGGERSIASSVAMQCYENTVTTPTFWLLTDVNILAAELNHEHASPVRSKTQQTMSLCQCLEDGR